MYILLFPPLVVALFGLAFFLLLLRWWRTGGILLLLALLLNAWGEVVALHPWSGTRSMIARAESDTAFTCRVMSYNVFVTGPYFARHRTNPEGAPEAWNYVRKFKSDLLVLSEYNPYHGRGFEDSILTVLPHKGNRYADGRMDIDMECNVYSRYPLTLLKSVRIHEDLIPDSLRLPDNGLRKLTYRDTQAWLIRVDAPQDSLLLVMVHLKSNQYALARKNVKADSTKSRWRDGIDDYLRGLAIGYDQRPREAETLRREVFDSLQWKGPIIVAGDFNDIGGSETLRRFDRMGLKNAWWKAGLGLGFTYDSYHLLLRLDHVLYSPQHFTPRAISVGNDAKFSDHYPIIVDLEWRK